MDMRLLGFESGAASTILVVGIVIVLLLTLVIAVARRRNNYAEGAVAVIAAAYGGVALASFMAVRYFANALTDMSRFGGGIASLSLGMGEAAQLPLSATWIAAAATVVAMLFVFPAMRQGTGAASDAGPGRLLATTGVALVAGVIPVLLFRGAIAFVLTMAAPGAQPRGVDIGGEVRARLTMASAGSAICFAVIVALMLLMFRQVRRATPSRAALRVVVVALVLSLGVSTALVVGLRSYSSRSLGVARGAPVSSLPGWPG
jgi:hypothetical protein